MKILITTDLFTIETNGVVTSVKNLASELEKKGHDVRILTLSEDTHSYKDKNVYYIRSMPFAVYPDVRMPLAYRHRLINELICWKPDVIHSQCEFFSFQFATYISNETGAPIVHTYHTLYEQYVTYVVPSRRLGKRIVRSLSKKRLKGVSRIIAPTRKVENTLSDYGIRNKMEIVPSGINLSQHKTRLSEEERKAKRRNFSIGDDQIVMINLGRLGTEKNLGELIEYFAKARKTQKNLVFMIVGDGPAKTQLEEMAKELSVSEYVIFTGMVAPSDVSSYYQLSDVFVSASTSETQGLTYVEAAANGLPLLCRKDLCLQGILKNGENGFEFSDEQEFLEGIKAISNDDAWREKASKISRSLAMHFDKAEFADAIERLYKSVIN